jgi:TolB-like protein
VTVHLVDAARDDHLWSAKFGATIEDVSRFRSASRRRSFWPSMCLSTMKT